jgi:hypothetical protein
MDELTIEPNISGKIFSTLSSLANLVTPITPNRKFSTTSSGKFAATYQQTFNLGQQIS